MLSDFAKKYGRAFIEILFVRLRSDTAKKLPLAGKIFVYTLALLLFYLPLLYFTIKKCIENPALIVYFAIIIITHILSKIMLCSSQKIQKRFAAVKQKKHFLMRIWLIVEYVVFMWLVYLFYPLTCILFPISLLSMSFESLLGYSIIFDFFIQNSENFILFGGVVSYILFIITSGYKKLRAGFLPDYLGLYAVLMIMSTSFGEASRIFIEYFSLDISTLATTLSWILSVSNNSMSIVATAITLFFAIHSLYKNCGTGATEEEYLPPAETQTKPAEHNS